ncbi:DUF1127 domain-containing protein [Mesorhizobium hawassense]|nr:DUF1127 domain-containing protein [Mesorhizobium hawassense]
MTIFGQELVADRSALSRLFAAIVETCRATGHFLARIVRIRRDRARLEEFPDHLLRDIGIGRGEMLSITRFGRREHGDA